MNVLKEIPIGASQNGQSERKQPSEIIIDTTMSFKKDFGLILTGAIIFLASFIWRDLIVEIKDYYFPRQASLVGRVIFVIVITIILLLFTVLIRNWFGLSNNEITFDEGPHGGYIDKSGHLVPHTTFNGRPVKINNAPKRLPRGHFPAGYA